MTAPSSSSGQPVVRARFCQEWLTIVEKEEEPYRGRFFARVTGELRSQIEEASRVAWVPLSTYIALHDILLETFGVAHAHDYYRRAFAHSLRGPVLGPLLQTAVRVLGLSPAALVRWAPRAYEGSFRNAGELSGEVLGPGRARLVYTHLPAMCTASDGFMSSPQGSAYGAYDVLGVEGVVRLDARGRAEGKMVVELEWTERRSGGESGRGGTG